MKTFDAAIQNFQRLLILKPDHLETHLILGRLLIKQRRPAAALERFHKGLSVLSGDSPTEKRARVGLYHGLGLALDRLDLVAAALEWFRRAIELAPGETILWCDLGESLRSLGRFDEARDCYARALQRDPDCVPAHAGRMRCQRYQRADHEEIINAETLLKKPGHGAEKRAALHFAIGKALDDCGVCDRAFHHIHRGNELQKRPLGDRFQHDLESIDRIMAFFDGAIFTRTGGSGLMDQRPVFIVGMPRSGSSLVEQILASHPRVHGAGEPPLIGELTESIPGRFRTSPDYPDNLTALDRDHLAQLAGTYLQGMTAHVETDPARIIDKMLYNFLYLGLIALLFPRARIIHCRRDAIDSCLSIYFQNFTEAPGYSHDLWRLGVYYRRYERLMAHWRRVLPLPMFEIHYEELVTDPERWSRALIDFLDLPWHAGCLSPHRSKRVVRTASSWQVRQPVHDRAINRWRRYERYYGPLIAGLEADTPVERKAKPVPERRLHPVSPADEGPVPKPIT